MNYWDEIMGTDEGAGSYMETYGEGPGCTTREIVASFINDGETVLDVGCGPGWNYDHFKECGPKVEYKGKDYSERFVRAANKRNPGVYEKGDLRDFGEPDKSWDVVIMQDALEHTNGYEKPIEEAIRVARKRIIITFWKASFMDGNESVDQINDDGNDGYGSTYNRERFEKYLTDTGYVWHETETPAGANRWHKYYVIELEK